MTVFASTDEAVEARLLELFKAAVNEEETDVWDARPNELHQPAENVYLGELVGAQAWAQLGARAREESYTIDVEVEVFREGTDVSGCKTRARQLMYLLVAPIEADPTLGVDRVRSAQALSRFRKATSAGDGGCIAKIVFSVAVTAQLRPT